MACALFAQPGVFLVRDRFEPLVGRALAGNLEGEVGEPAVGRGAVPVLHVGRDVDHVARSEADGLLALLLVPAASGHADEHLPAALRGAVDVPVVAAAGLEGHVVEGNLLARDGGQIAVAREVFGVGRVGLADGEYHFALEGGLVACAGGVVGPYVLGHAEGGPGVGPSSVEGDVGEHF